MEYFFQFCNGIRYIFRRLDKVIITQVKKRATFGKLPHTSLHASFSEIYGCFIKPPVTTNGYIKSMN